MSARANRRRRARACKRLRVWRQSARRIRRILRRVYRDTSDHHLYQVRFYGVPRWKTPYPIYMDGI